MTRETVVAKVIVTDTGPLITLAAAQRLDYLLAPRLPVYIPDAVLHEATKDVGSLCARSILEWRDANKGAIHTVSTEAFLNYVQDLERFPGRRVRDLGERAAIEAIHDAIDLRPGEHAILVTEDDKLLRQVLVTQPDLSRLIIPLTTRDFLDELEASRRINSTDAVYDAASLAGRTASRKTILPDQTPERRAAIARAFAQQRDES